MATVTTAEPMAASDYFAAPGLSFSGMKHLAISPLRFWHLCVNPDRPKDEPTPAMEFGSAVHASVLEPAEFDKRYACECVPPADCLDTIDDLRQAYLEATGKKASGSAKGPMIEQVLAVLPNAPILAVLKAEHAQQHAGKAIFKQADWKRIQGAAQALRNEPRVQEILSEGQAEVAMFAVDPDTGVRLKCKMDWVRPTLTADVKTFSQQRGKSIDRSVTDAIYYEKYHWQAYTYSLIRSLQAGDTRKSAAQKAPEFAFLFVESEEPFEVRLRVLRPHIGGEVNMLWEHARIEVRALIRTYAEYSAKFGVKPWRYAREIDPVVDEEIPGLAFGR